MARFDNRLRERDTEVVSEGDEQVIYESTTPGFSIFVASERAASETTESTDGPDTESSNESTEPTETDDDTLGFGFLAGLVALLDVTLAFGRYGPLTTDE